MAPPTPAQTRWRRRVEALLRVVAPGLDLLLAVGDRVSRVAGRDDLEWVPPRRTLPVADAPRR